MDVRLGCNLRGRQLTHMNVTAVPSQPTVATLRSAYAQLWHAVHRHLGGQVAGRLILGPPLSEGGAPFAMAAGIAGAASLTIEPAPDAAREAVRNGTVDFAVNTLDEALRILKNEIRKQQAVSVLLEANVSEVLAEAAERGAQPDLIAWSQPDDPRIAPFLQRGAVLLSPVSQGEAEDAREGWIEVSWRMPDASPQALRRVDALAAEVLLAGDLERRHWIARAPRYLPRNLRTERSLSMSPDERERFRSALERAVAAGEIPGGVQLQIGAQIAIQTGGMETPPAP
jgi:urocanate hydratase